MSEREKLEAAIQHLEDYAASWPVGELVRPVPSRDPAPGKNYSKKFATVLDAARKHLDALPKTKPVWRVTGLRDDGTKVQTIVYWDRDRALDGARAYVDTGYRDVNLVKIEVPA